MIKLDRKNSTKICALALTSALMLPIIGCSSQNKKEETDERFSHSTGVGFYITDNETDIQVRLSDEIIDKIKKGEKNITISFNDTDINIDESETAKIREDLNKLNSFEDSHNIMFFMVFGILYPIIMGTSSYFLTSYVLKLLRDRELGNAIKNMNDEEFDDLCERYQNDKHYIRKIQNMRKSKNTKKSK